MKNFAVFILFFLFALGYYSITANVPQVSAGVFQGFKDLQQGRGIASNGQPSAIFEKKADACDSNVFDIHGQEQFERIVIGNSRIRPVVLKIYLPTHKDINQITDIFQDVAQSFDHGVIFAGLDVVKNAQLYMQIYTMCNLKNIELPLFLFYDKGQLKMPFLTGFQHKDYFVEYIKKMFFTQNDVVGVN